MNRTADSTASLAERIDALLPQTQCTRCGYGGCRPYAEAIAADRAPINRCPPGGAAGIQALASLTGLAPAPLDPRCGQEKPAGLARIDPLACIGCARCLPACPVDAILGARQHLHTVLETDCNGCELCLTSCPVDCIVMRPRTPDAAEPSPAENRSRHDARVVRLARLARERARVLTERKRAVRIPP